MKSFECRKDKSVSSAEVVNALQQDGVCILRRLISDNQIKALRDEALALGRANEDWLVHLESTTGFFCSFSPLVARKLNHDNRIANIREVFAQPLFKEICKGYLGRGWHVERVLLHLKQVEAEPLTPWHADQFAHDGKCLKFMAYLNDIGPMNGAFSYVTGSHRLINCLVRQAEREHLDNRSVHNYEQIYSVATRACVSESPPSEAIRRILSEAQTHIKSGLESDDFYSIAAEAGSVIVFDANGIHRGGLLTEGERFIIRSHCYGRPSLRALSSKNDFAALLQRSYFRCITRADQASLV